MNLQDYNYWDNEYIQEEQKQIEVLNELFQEWEENEISYDEYLKWDDTYDFIASLPNVKEN